MLIWCTRQLRGRMEKRDLMKASDRRQPKVEKEQNANAWIRVNVPGQIPYFRYVLWAGGLLSKGR